MKSWSKRELALSVLVVLAAVTAPYVVARPLAQLLYAGDDVSGAAWDARGWDRRHGVRANLLRTALELMETF